MTTAIKRRRGTTVQHSTFTGLEGELTVDTTKDTVVVHDGSTAGGFALLREDLSNNTNVASTATTQTFTNKTINLSSNTLSGTTAQFNTALSDGDFATLAGTETLSNKTFSTNPTISSGTANGVAYLNGSKVLTSGSALTFDGGLFGVNTTTGSMVLDGSILGYNGSITFKNSGTAYAYIGLNAQSGQLSINSGQTGQSGYFTTFGAGDGTEKMRLTSTGLGIGTSSPSVKLDVNGSFKSVNFNVVDVSGVSALSGGTSTRYTYFGNNNTSAAILFYGSAHASDAQNIEFYSGGAVTMRLNSSGNLGLGVTPSAWSGSYKAIEIGSLGCGITVPPSTSNVSILANAYSSVSGWTYAGTGYATRYTSFTSSGYHAWYTAPSGTAGNAISFTQAMTLDASGNLGIGTATPSCKLDVIQSSVGSSGATSNGIRVITTGTTNGLAIGQSNSARYLGLGQFSVYSYGEELHLGTANANPILFNTSAAEKMRLDSSGNLGIGTSSPSVKLHVASSSSSTFSRIDNSAYRVYLGAESDGNGIYSQTIGGTDALLRFYTGSTERMRLDSSGNLLVGTTSSTNGSGYATRQNIVAPNNSYCISAVSPNEGYATLHVSNTGASGTRYFQTFHVNGYTQVGAITSNGTSTTYATSSDYRLKENIQPMQGALDVVAQLNPVTYKWKADGSDGQGFIAHELQAVVPDCVTGEKDAVDAEGKPVYQGIDTSFLVATLTKAIQELEARVKQLENK